jgi:hypothetical protein
LEDTKLIGAITSRPLTIYFNNQKTMNIYYVDYLCVNKLYRKKNIAPQLIQTHEYHQSHQNKEIAVSLFKREGELTAIVPLTFYYSYCFDMSNWMKPVAWNNSAKIINCDYKNIYYLYTFIEEQKKQQKWKLVCLPSIANLLELVKTNNIYISMILEKNEIKSAYFFRKVCTCLSKDKYVISCFATIYTNKINENQFIHGFKVVLSEIIQKNPFFYYLCIENISDNNMILQNLLQKSNPILQTKMAYYFYNFAYQSISSNQILMIN